MGQVMLPIVVDLGKKSRKRIRELKLGRGELMQDVAETVEQVRTDLGSEAAGKDLVPVILLYNKKPKRRRLGIPLPF